MTFNLLSRFILWLKNIFYILPEKKTFDATQPPEEKSIKVAPAKEIIGKVSPAEEEKPVEVPPSEEKIIEVTALPEERLPEETSEEEIPTAEAEHTKKEVKTKKRKPYKKKVLREERTKEPIKPSENEKKIVDPKQRKIIDLGSSKRKKLRSDKQLQQPSEVSIDDIAMEKENLQRVESPFVEIDLDESKVFLILPQQQFKVDTADEIPQQLSYDFQLNGEKKKVTVKVTDNNRGFVSVQEKRIHLENPLGNFQVVFPGELQGRTYSYSHNNQNLYAFVAIGNNRGRMHYLYDKDRNINSLPKRDVWVLLNEDFELKIEPDLIEERWIWEKYRPLRVDLKEMDELIVKNSQTNEEERLPCETTFSIKGEQLVEDDFKYEMPIFIGKTLKIKAPWKNDSGWNIWIQNKVAGYRVVAENWNGAESINLKLPDDLPCECGEFQMDICHRDTGIPDETLFFRWLPFIELCYSKELIIPDPHQGHKSELIKINFGDIQEWELKYKATQKTEFVEDGYYQIELPPEEDTLPFSIAKRGKPETGIGIQLTIPRLKWKITEMTPWKDKKLKIDRNKLARGEELDLFINTNDQINKYEISAFLEEKGQPRQGPVRFKLRGGLYLLGLNEFYDTIDSYKGEIELKIIIQREGYPQILGEFEIIYIPKDIVGYYRGKNSKESFSEEDLAELNCLFEKCANTLRSSRIMSFVDDDKLSLPMIFKQYIDRWRGQGEQVNEGNVLCASEHYESFFEEIKNILSLPWVLYLWFYNHIEISFLPISRDGLYFYLTLFKNRKKDVQFVFERKSYENEFIDDTLSLLKQAWVYLGISPDPTFKMNFALNPEYRKTLFFNDVADPGDLRYLVEKWKYHLKKNGTLAKMDSDIKLLGRETIEEGKNMRIGGYISHEGALDMNIEHRIEVNMKFIPTTEKDRAVNDAKNYLKEYVNKNGDEKHANRSS